MTGQPSGLLLDCLGFLACGLVLCTFSMTSMRALRLVAMASNPGVISHAWLMGLWPILALHTVLLPLNAVRLLQMERRGRAARHPAPTGAMTAPGTRCADELTLRVAGTGRSGRRLGEGRTGRSGGGPCATECRLGRPSGRPGLPAAECAADQRVR
ncbi:MAG: hypothetical protein ICV73_13790 [Acetobacteraceae bacterium]|nr:hypothetical protein [Acetobacteraceae bacterium]